jgi:hypothetical protein
MGKTLAYEVALLKMLLNGTPFANVFDNAASSPITVLYLSLHTADPGSAGTQSTSEVTYTSYARVGITRTTSGWTVSATTGIATPVSTITFPTPTGGTGQTATYAGVGRDATGSGFLFYSGLITPSIIIGSIAPQLTVASTIGEG